MSLFGGNRNLDLEIRGKRTQGSLVYEKPKDIAIRLLAADSNEATAPLASTGDYISVQFRRGNYDCSFEAKITDFMLDLSDPEKSWVANIGAPGKIHRVLKIS